MEMLKSVCTTICCTKLCQVYTVGTLENSEANTKCDEKIHHDKLQDLPKAIFTTDENLTQPEHLDEDVLKLIIAPNKCNEVCEEFGENSKTKSSNASTSISNKFCSHNARFAKQCIQKQDNSKKNEWKMEVIITDSNGYLSNFDEQYRYNAVKSIASEIDIQDLLFKLSPRAESTRIFMPQIDNMTTSTAYIPCQEEDDKAKKEDKAEAKKNQSFVKLRKRMVTVFRRCFHKNVL